METVAFDPCTVTDSTVAALKLDPATKVMYGEQLKQQGAERGCVWKDAPLNSTVSLNIGRSTRVVQEYADNTSFRDKVRTVVGARDAVRFNTGGPETNCSLAVQVTGGVIVFTANTRSVTVNVPPASACPEVERLAAGIEPLLPRWAIRASRLLR